MKIVINAVFMHEYARGVGRAGNSLLTKLADIDSQNEYYIYYGEWQKYDFLKINKPNFHFVKLTISKDALRRNLYLAFILPFKIKKHQPDIYHILDTSPVIIKTCPTVSTIHDLAEYTVPEKYNPVKCFFRKKYVYFQAHLSDQLITVSEYTKKDIIKRFKLKADKVHVIYNFFENDKHFLPDRKFENYFLIVGEIERTKNIGTIIEAYDMLDEKIKKEYQIFIVGRKGNDYQNIKKLINRKNLNDRIIIFDYVSDKKLFTLYENAYALVFASLFEGFGLPILEAMSFGIPVISSNSTSLCEVAGDAALLFNPEDSNELCNHMMYLINNPNYRIDMINKGFVQARFFNADHSVKDLLVIYKGMSR